MNYCSTVYGGAWICEINSVPGASKFEGLLKNLYIKNVYTLVNKTITTEYFLLYTYVYEASKSTLTDRLAHIFTDINYEGLSDT